MRYGAEIDGTWVVRLGWTAGLTVTPEGRGIGWTVAQRARRRRAVANNARFLILPEFQIPNVASRILATNARFARHGRHWLAHGVPKGVWGRPLAPPARTWVRAPFDVPTLRPATPPVLDLNQVSLAGADG